MRFIGSAEAKIDAKGRAFLPASFRRVLQASGEAGLVMSKDIFQPCLSLYPESVWNERLDTLHARLNPWSKTDQQLLRQYISDVEQVVLDTSGRLLIPKRYMKLAGISGQQIKFIGMDSYIEIWAEAEDEKLRVSAEEFAKAIEENQETYDQYVKDAMQLGLRYPDATNKALSMLLHKEVRTPNDLLGLAYVKEIIHHHYQITPHVIKRTNDYHETQLEAISSATALRKALLKNEDVQAYLPEYVAYQNDHFFSLDEFFEELKYAVLFHHDLSRLHLVEEGLDHRLVKTITQVNSMHDLVEAMSSKRYTKVRIQRMLCHILLNNTKEDVKAAMQIDYIRLLAFNDHGRELIKIRKDQTDFHILTSINQYDHPALAIEKKASLLLSLKDETVYKKEYRSIPYLKKS